MKNKRISIFIVLSCLMGALQAQPAEKITSQQMNLSGKVSYMQVNTYKAGLKDGEIQRQSLMREIQYTFTKQGDLSEQKNYANDKLQRRNGGIPLHASASINFNYLIKKMGLEKTYPLINDGAKIYYLYLKPNKYQFNAIAFTDHFPDEFREFLQIDYDKMYEKQFEKPLRDILEKCDLTLEEIRRLDEFF